MNARKLLIPLAAILTWGTILQAAEQPVYPKDQAKVLFFTSKTCRYCAAMEHNVLPAKAIRDEISKYSGGKITYVRWEDKESRKLFVQYRVSQIPTIMITTSDGKPIKRGVGYMNIRQLQKFLADPLVINGRETFLIFGGVTLLKVIIIILAKLALLILS